MTVANRVKRPREEDHHRGRAAAFFRFSVIGAVEGRWPQIKGSLRRLIRDRDEEGYSFTDDQERSHRRTNPGGPVDEGHRLLVAHGDQRINPRCAASRKVTRGERYAGQHQ